MQNIRKEIPILICNERNKRLAGFGSGLVDLTISINHFRIMTRTNRLFVAFVTVVALPWLCLGAEKILVPMDLKQADHLKAYGLTYWALARGYKAEWLLNYRGGSFLLDDFREIQVRARVMGVSFEMAAPPQVAQVYATIEENNMDAVKLEKAPKLAVYTPPGKKPWDDAVTLALTYAEIPYEKIWDPEVLTGGLQKYDWLHLHHEDFTGQYSKFYGTYRTFAWYQTQQREHEAMAGSLGFRKVSQMKKAVAGEIRSYVERGGFLFAMCCAPVTLDMALAAAGTDIVAEAYDGDPVDPAYRSKMNFTDCFAFEKFSVFTDPLDGRHCDIDVNMVNTPMRVEAYDFTLFDFSAKFDPVPCMLVQNHMNTIKGFYGLATSFNRKTLKKRVLVLGELPEANQIRYIHGNTGQGQFSFYGGHDPEDYAHEIGSPATDLSKHKNSPGYRLILNNVLFPSAKKKNLKT